MSSFSFTLLLVVLCCYAASGKLAAGNELRQQQQQQPHRQQLQRQQKLRQQHASSEAGENLGANLLHWMPTQLVVERPLPSSESRSKRSQRDVAEYDDWTELMEELEDNALLQSAALPAEFEVENMSPLTYFLLLQKLKQLQSSEAPHRVRTPRLGRSIDFQLEDDGRGDTDDTEARKRRFLARLMKKSVPFKPRLGKRTQVCE